MQYFIHNQQTGKEYLLTSDQLRTAKAVFEERFPERVENEEEAFANYVTGFEHDDAYADAAEELAVEFNGDCVEACDGNRNLYETVRAYHRIMNLCSDHLTDEQCEDSWQQDFHATGADED